MSGYFTSTKERPYHLSIGAVVVNSEGKLLCHHYTQFGGQNYDAYLLMKETAHPGESPEQTVHRGLLEEFGAKGTIIGYLGSHVTQLPRDEVTTEKTTLYFLVDYIESDESLRSEEDKNQSTVEWQTVEFLIEKMKEQTRHFNGRQTMDESVIIGRALNFKK